MDLLFVYTFTPNRILKNRRLLHTYCEVLKNGTKKFPISAMMCLGALVYWEVIFNS